MAASTAGSGSGPRSAQDAASASGTPSEPLPDGSNNPLMDHFSDLMAVLPRISQYSRTINRGELVEQALADSGVAVDRPSMSVLSSLSMAGEPLRVGEIARRMNVAGPHVTRLVHDLERRGLARRVSDPEDGRARLVELTQSGTDAATAYLRSILGWMGGALTHWSAADLQTLGTLLSRLIDDLNAYAAQDAAARASGATPPDAT